MGHDIICCFSCLIGNTQTLKSPPAIHPCCCCSYAGYNLSRPRLPQGLAFSTQLHPVSNRPGQTELGLGNTNYRGMRRAF